MNEVIDFINRRWFDADGHFLNGNCYWFAHILSHRFPNLTIYYDYVIGHFVAGDGKEFYDWLGYYSSNTLVSLDKIQKEDHLWYDRLMRDCRN